MIFLGCSKSVLQDVFIAQKCLVRALAGERYWPADTPLCSARPFFERLDASLFDLFVGGVQIYPSAFAIYFRISVADVHEQCYKTSG